MHTPLQSCGHVVLIVVGVLRDSEGNNEGKFDNNKRQFNHKAGHKHGLL